MNALKLYIQVTAGVIPGKPAPEFSKRWEWVINENAGVKYEGRTLSTPEGVSTTGEYILAYHKLCDDASAYARQLQNPGFVNWVKLEWVWL